MAVQSTCGIATDIRPWRSRSFRRNGCSPAVAKRHSLGGREAVANLGGGKARRELKAVLIDRRLSECVSVDGFKQPVSVFESGFLRLDPFLELIIVVEPEDGQAREPHALSFASGGVDDGLSVAVDLVDPETGSILHTASRR